MDVSGLFTDEDSEDDRIEYTKWDRPAMGLTGSPYTCVQGSSRGKRVTLGKREDRDNVFHWEDVVVNLPGTFGYDATQPKIYEQRSDGLIAADLVIYIDDVRTVANAREEAWRASSEAAKTCAWLGLQDSALKRREPSLKPGAWAGTVIWASEGEVKKMVTQERWKNTQNKLDWIHRAAKGERGGDIIAECPQDNIPHKTLESIRGFLVYVAPTYMTLVPYPKGIHLILDSWRANRGDDGWPIDDDDGWRLANTIDNIIEDEVARQGGLEPSKFVKTAARLGDDLKMLHAGTTGILRG
jgi:hypothetical protein